MEKYVEVKAVQEFAGTFLGDPILKMAVNAALDHAPAADVSQLNSAEKQAVFRLGQMDMRESAAAALTDAVAPTKGVVHGTIMAAVEIVNNLKTI